MPQHSDVYPPMSAFEEVVSYNSAAEFQARPAYHARLEVTSEDLDRIVGKYTLPAARMAWIECGLNRCNEPHRHGFVIRTKDGRETHCGSQCGHREFGVKFAEVEARAARAIEAQSLRAVAADLLARKSALLTSASELIESCQVAEAEVVALRSLLGGQRRFRQFLESAAKAGGCIRSEVEAPPDPTARAQGKPRTVMVNIAIVAGCSHLVAEPTRYSNVIRVGVIDWLQALGPDLPLDKRALAEVSKGAGRCDETLQRANRYLAETGRLLETENLKKLQLIPDRLMRPEDITPELRHVLDALSSGARPSQVRVPRRR